MIKKGVVITTPYFFGCLLAQFQLLEKRAVALQVGVVEVLEQALALANHFEKAAFGVFVVFLTFEVTGDVVDALGEHSDLSFCRSGVCRFATVFRDDRRFAFFGNHLIVRL